MLSFFDYLFYKTCEFYYKREGDSGFRLSGVLIVSAMQGFNLLSILSVFILVGHDKSIITKLNMVILAVILLILNGIRYNKDKYDYHVLKERWRNEEKRIRSKKENLVIAYIALSTLLTLGLSIYVGSKKF